MARVFGLGIPRRWEMVCRTWRSACKLSMAVASCPVSRAGEQRSASKFRSSMPAPIKVCIVEDDARLRESLSVLLDGSHEFRCVGAYPNAETALKQIPAAWPDV